MQKPKLVVICPVFNEDQVIPLFFARFQPVHEKLLVDYDIDLLFCNNSSTDGTVAAVEKLRSHHPYIYMITLSRNVGYQRSVECGLRNAKGDLFVIIDVDCEDPPEMISEFLAKHREGYDIVYGERIDREETQWIQSLRKLFYRLMKSVADENIILDMAEFSLMTSEVRDAIVQDKTSFPFIRASIGRVGFNILGMPYKREKRIAGDTHYNLIGMAVFAVAGILSSSTLLLRLPIYILPFWMVAIISIFVKMTDGPESWMFPALISIIALYVGSTLAFIGIYVARIYKNSLGRPNFIIRRQDTYLQRPSILGVI